MGTSFLYALGTKKFMSCFIAIFNLLQWSRTAITIIKVWVPFACVCAHTPPSWDMDVLLPPMVLLLPLNPLEPTLPVWTELEVLEEWRMHFLLWEQGYKASAPLSQKVTNLRMTEGPELKLPSCDSSELRPLLACLPFPIRYPHSLLGVLSWVRLFATLLNVARQDPLAMRVLQARILEWVPVSCSRGSSQPRDQTHISYVSCIGRWFFTTMATWEAPTRLPYWSSLRFFPYRSPVYFWGINADNWVINICWNGMKPNKLFKTRCCIKILLKFSYYVSKN